MVKNNEDLFISKMNKDIEVHEEKIVRNFYDKNGQITQDETKSIAKMSYDEQRGEGTAFYYIRMYRGELLDPHAIDKNISTLNRAAFKEKKVSKNCFEGYIKYLKTKNRLYFTRSRRLSMEN